MATPNDKGNIANIGVFFICINASVHFEIFWMFHRSEKNPAQNIHSAYSPTPQLLSESSSKTNC